MRGAPTCLVFLVACGASTGLAVPDAGDTGCVPESCNGMDDDCDGFVDDGLFCFSLDGEPIEAAARGACGPEWYSYGVPDPESANPTPDLRVSDEAVLAVQAGEGDCGAYVAVIADLPRDGSMGSLDGDFQLTEGALEGVAVGDEPRECAFDAARERVTCGWVWQSCCTDGVLLGPFREDFCLTTTLSNPEGLRRLIALDGTTRVPLAFGATVEICGTIRPRR